MDGLAVLQCNNPEKTRCRLAGAYYLTPEANTPVGLYFSVERLGHDLGAPSRVDVRPLGEYLLFEIPGGLHTDSGFVGRGECRNSTLKSLTFRRKASDSVPRPRSCRERSYLPELSCEWAGWPG